MEHSPSSTDKGSRSGRTHGHETPVEEHPVAVLFSLKDYRPALERIADAIHHHAQVLQIGFELMANDFSKLSAGLDALASVITQVIFDLNNPETNNSDQGVIDSLTTRLQGAVDSLTAADTAAKAAGAGTVATPPVTAPADGSGSADVTP